MKAAILFFALCATAAFAPPTLADCAAPAPCRIAPVIADIPVGGYTLDKANSHIIFRISHLGFSHYTASFARFDAQLYLDPAHPERASILTTIDANSLVLATAPPGFRELLLGSQFLNTGKYPAITFRSSEVVMTAPDEARVTGNFSLHGITRQIALKVTFKGGTRAAPNASVALVRFSVRTGFQRSAFGLGTATPLIAGDKVKVEIDAAFTGPQAK